MISSSKEGAADIVKSHIGNYSKSKIGTTAEPTAKLLLKKLLFLKNVTNFLLILILNHLAKV